MRKRLFSWELFGFGFVCLLGTAGHFLYDWTGENSTVGAFFAVNESVWEHMKLLFVPYFLYVLAECFSLAREMENFLSAKAAGALCGTLSIPLLYYTLSGIFGKLPEWAGIAIFFVSAAIAFSISHRVMKQDLLRGGLWQALGFLTLWALLFLFVRFTFHPPALPLFRDPITGQSGIWK